MHSSKRAGNRVVRPERQVVVGKVGELKSSSDDESDEHNETTKRKELLVSDKTFVIRDELDAVELKNGSLTCSLSNRPDIFIQCSTYELDF